MPLRGRACLALLLAVPGSLASSGPPQCGWAPLPAASLPHEVGEYVLTRLIGCGQTGQAFTGHRRARPGRDFVVKRQPVSRRAGVNTTVEVQCMRALKGTPNVVQIVDVFNASLGGVQFSFIVQELAKGRNLEAILEERHRLPDPARPAFLEEYTRILTVVIRAAAAIHRLGIQHGDLMIDNIVYDEQTGEVTIVDLGLCEFTATVADDARTLVTAFVAVLLQGFDNSHGAETLLGFLQTLEMSDWWEERIAAYLKWRALEQWGKYGQTWLCSDNISKNPSSTAVRSWGRCPPASLPRSSAIGQCVWDTPDCVTKPSRV